jgi:hypothetical protein
MAFFPSGSVVYKQFPQDTTLGLASSLKKLGYSCTAIHPWSRASWNREDVYESMGFDIFYTQEDFENPETVRWISDKATYEKIIDLYEKKEEDQPMFILDITMQGHGGYNTGAVFDNPVTVENGEYPLTNEYLSSTYVSDKAFEYLIEYFSEQDEPTLIFMFGDHQPAVEDAFYEQLLGKSLTDLTLEETQERYVTPYILWTNYDIDSEELDISANEISTIIKENAGLQLNAYESFIQSFSETIPLINANGYMDADGNWYGFDEQNQYEELLYQYKVIQYAIYCDGLSID